MQINGSPATGGALVLQIGETGQIDAPGGPLAVRVEYDGGETAFDIDGNTVVLKNTTSSLGHTITFGAGIPGRPALHLRFQAWASQPGQPVAIIYTAVQTG